MALFELEIHCDETDGIINGIYVEMAKVYDCDGDYRKLANEYYEVLSDILGSDVEGEHLEGIANEDEYQRRIDTQIQVGVLDEPEDSEIAKKICWAMVAAAETIHNSYINRSNEE